MPIPITYIKFPEVDLHQHYGHKLRGYFGNLFKEKSPLLHNHYDDGRLRYAYPLVQYKVIDNIPMLVGFGEGSELLIELFTRIKRLELGNFVVNIYSKNLKRIIYEPEILKDNFNRYKFKSLWMGLNQNNFKKYSLLLPGAEQTIFLSNILVGNILSFFKGVGYRAEDKISALPEVKPRTTMFKNKKMTAFSGEFHTNVSLPDFAGLGKSVSRGFGTIESY